MDNDEDSKESEPTNVFAYVGNFFQSLWVRYFICRSDEIHKFILGYGFNFLPNFGTLLFFILVIKEILKVICQ